MIFILPESFELSFELLERLPISEEAKLAMVLPIEELCFCFGSHPYITLKFFDFSNNLKRLKSLETEYEMALSKLGPMKDSNLGQLQGGRTWQPFVGSKNGNENIRQVRVYNFRVKCVAFARNRKFTN